MPRGRRKKLDPLSRIKRSLPFAKIERADNRIIVSLDDPSKIPKALDAIRKAGFENLVFVSAVDLMEEIEVIYCLSSYDNSIRDLVLVKVSLPEDEPRVPSICSLWPAAEYHERETHELFGVIFEGNPRLEEKLLLPDWWDEGYPMRKSWEVGSSASS